MGWTLGLILADWVRHDASPAQEHVHALLTACAFAVAMHNLGSHALCLYRGRYAYGTFEEVRAVFATAAITTLALVGGNLLCSDPLPPSAPLTGGTLALVAMLGIRYTRRLQRERRARPVKGEPILVVGAGQAGSDLVRSMVRDPNVEYVPVGLVDDDPTKRRLRVSGIPVLGDRAALPELLSETKARAVVFAIPNARSDVVRETQCMAEAAGVPFKVLPTVNRLLDRRATIADIRDGRVVDLLGRRQISTDLTSIAGYLLGRRVLVTGAGGSIGSELCRQIHSHGPAELLMLDRDESALHAVSLSIYGRALLDSPDILLADLRDAHHIDSLFARHRPEVVFHAAALKHQPLLEQYPAEALKTNVWGTQTVLDAAVRHGVQVLINISTDKAADPCSVLGYSKRAAERLTAHAALRSSRRYLSVRFGNVLGSRGSVITAFAAQIVAGGPVTVTDPKVTRYFMTVQEAVGLVIQAGAIGEPGQALVLDMGEPVRITDLARQMIALSGEPVDVVYTGLRPGEKLDECLFGRGERDERPTHPLISQVAVPPLDPGDALALDQTADHHEVIDQLTRICDLRPAHAFASAVRG